MTDRDELRDRLDDLESRFDTEPVNTLDEQTREQLDQMVEDAKERLTVEEMALLDDPSTPTAKQLNLLLDAEPET